MRSVFSDLGRRLGSVALRYSHPNIAGFWKTPLSKGICRFLTTDGLKKPDNGGGDYDRDGQITRLEAVFFLSQQPQTSRKLAKLAGLADGTQARTLVRTLNRRYDTEGSAFRIEEVAGGFQMMTRSKFAPWLRRLHAAPTEVRLSAPAMETLAVVAYRQPVLRADVEAIRGVQSGEVLRQLIERDLVRIVGRSEELGRPFLYGTTKQFLQIFGLRHLEELPRADHLRNRRPEETTCQTRVDSDTNIQNSSHQSPEAEEENNVKSLITVKPRQNAFAEGPCATVTCPDDNLSNGLKVFDAFDEDSYETAVAEEDEDDLDDDFEDEDEEEDDEEEEDWEDDEPWEEVDDEDEEDFDDDDDWEDDEDFDDDDWDDDEDEEEEEEEEDLG